jgi:hypothetical protein
MRIYITIPACAQVWPDVSAIHEEVVEDRIANGFKRGLRECPIYGDDVTVDGDEVTVARRRVH